jgi:transcriptional regulator with XRE-family HTH domain
MVTNKEIASWLGISQQALSNFVRGNAGMSMTRLLLVARRTGIPIEKLLTLRGGRLRGARLKVRLRDAYRTAKDRDQAVG